MEYRKKRIGVFSSLILLCIIGAIGYFGYQTFFLDIPKLNQDKVEATFKGDADYHYFYDQLNKEDQERYKDIFYGLVNFNEKIPMVDTTVKQMGDILTCIINDHPELYYVNSSYQYQDMNRYFYFIPQYDHLKNEVDKINKQIEENTKEIIEKTKQEQSSVDKAKLVYDFVIDNNEYQENKKDQNIMSSLIDGKTVCAGYARAYQYIMNRVGEKCSYVVGIARESNGQVKTGEAHAWSMLNIDDDFYYCDTTWGDNATEGTKHSCSGFFMMTSNEMLKCYEPDDKYEVTQNNKINYFADESSYMTEYDPNILSRAVKKGLQDKTRVAEVKCGNEQVYNTVKNKLKNDYLGYKVLSENGCFSDNTSYSWDDEMLLIELYY